MDNGLFVILSLKLRIDDELLFLEDDRLVEILESEVLGTEWTNEKLKLLLVSSTECSFYKKFFLILKKPPLQ